MSDNIVEISNLTFGYDESTIILDGVSLFIPQGKIVAIMGGSGSGKTTLLKLITKQYEAQSGTISVFDTDISTLSTSGILKMRKKIGVLFQFGALFTDISVFDNIAFSLREHTNLPSCIIKTIVDMKLQAVGLFGSANLFPNELSGGMSRRIALARSIALDPSLMLYDEPFTGLDPISLSITANLIKELNATLNQTSILVTHDIEASFKIADYIYFLANGKIVASGTPIDIKNSHDPMVRQFIHGEIDGPFAYRYNTKNKYAFCL